MRPIALFALIILGSTGTLAQGRAPASVAARSAARSAAASLDCRACHTAVTPTKEAPALAACPRLQVKGYHAVAEAPVAITLGKAGAKYGLVKFEHRAHAHMAETGKGCNGCHHYDQARPIQKCKNCHAVSRRREDLSKPDLKAAMHRQCLDCHLDWNPKGACSTCHQTKASAVAGAADKATPPKPKTTVAAPQKIVYETAAKEGKSVTFFHADHTQRFALACADCHQQQACRACHDSKRAGADNAVLTVKTAKGLTDEQAHARCTTCHANDACATCHKVMPTPAIGFDHGRRTGFPLNRFHAPLTCKQCHTAPGAYGRVAADCESCHKGWQAKFDHAKAGLVLDEQHTGADCVGCHEDKAFRATPVCTSCHTDKTWPTHKPGKTMARPAARK
ncbi:MAG: cytochrome c3 family protein [Gemmatimonadetes bacterium]|nr:cytochrome c3 family protein [Gemmatimonadota bacterium]